MKTKLIILFLCLISFNFALADASKIKVGVIAPLSGPLAEYGVAVRNGLGLFQSNNPELAENLEFIYEDSQWDSKLAIAAFNKLRTNDQVDVIFNWGNPTTEAIAPLAKRYKLPLLAMSLDPKVARNNPYLIRTSNPAIDFSKQLCLYFQEKNYKKIGVILAENTYVQGLFDGLNASCGFEIEDIATYKMLDNDFKTTITKLKLKDYDAIGVFLISGQISTFYRQLKTLKLEVPTFGTDFFESATEIRMAHGGMEGAVYPHLAVSSEFKEQYSRVFGNDLQIAYAGNAYDIAIYLASLLDGKLKLSSDQIIQSLKIDKIFQGVGGMFNFTDNKLGGPHVSFPIHIKKIEKDKIISLN